jgi:hypothetical protein
MHKEQRMTAFLSWSRRLDSPVVAGMLCVMLVSALAGCSSIAVWLGLRVRLDSVPVNAVTASLASRRDGAAITALAPGQSAQLVLVASTADGKQYPTVGAGRGKVAFDNYRIDASVVQVSARGRVSLSSDPRVSEGQEAHIKATPVAHPDVVAALDVPVRYDIVFVADFSGHAGFNGADGLAGLDGMRGTDATPTTDPVTGAPGQPGPGGNGADGGAGGDGGNGQDGAPGEAVHIWVRLTSGPKTLLQVRVESPSHEALYLVDPVGGSLKVLANGGQGGRAGQGGQGGRGGAGGSGSPSGTNGLDGRRGWDGRPGQGGRAGTIWVTIDPAARAYLDFFSWSNRSGEGIAGAPPSISVAPVAPLW